MTPIVVSLESQTDLEAILIQFLRAELPPSQYRGIPFALIWYQMAGSTEHSSARLDLGKRAFLDHFEDPEVEQTFADSAPKIVRILETATV